MAKNSPTGIDGGSEVAPQASPRTLVFAKNGIRTGEDFANTMSALMSDLIEGHIPPEVGNAVCNAGGKLLKVVEMQFKYASSEKPKRPDLRLASAEEDSSPASTH